jgi:hypothetical protein
LTISIINAHAPTEDKEEEEEEAFYEKLERAYGKLVGDMNAKTGKENILRNHAGMYSVHKNTSEIGGRLVNCSFQEYVYQKY